MNDRLYRSRDDRMIAGVAGGLAELWGADPSLIRILWALLVIFTGGIALIVYIVMAIIVPEEDDVWPATTAPGVAAPPPSQTPPAASMGLTSDPAATTVTPTPGAPMGTSGSPLVTPAAEPGALWASPPMDPHRAARAEARAQRRAARAQRRASGGLNGALLGGAILIAIGVFFLLREFWPQFDFDWFWPAMLILLGVVLLAVAFGRKPQDPGGTGTPGTSGTPGAPGSGTGA